MRKDNKIGRPGALVGLVVAVIGAGVVGLSWHTVSSRADQKSDFKADMIAMDQRFAGEPSWDDEVNLETGKSESKLELVVKIGGCHVEVQRLEGERDSTTINEHVVEHFSIDEVVGEIEDIKGKPKGALSPSDIQKFLQDYRPKLTCAN